MRESPKEASVHERDWMDRTSSNVDLLYMASPESLACSVCLCGINQEVIPTCDGLVKVKGGHVFPIYNEVLLVSPRMFLLCSYLSELLVHILVTFADISSVLLRL